MRLRLLAAALTALALLHRDPDHREGLRTLAGELAALDRTTAAAPTPR